MIKRIFFALALAAALAGCGSSVKLNDIPVEDKAGTSVTGPAGTQAERDATKSNVTQVDLGATARDSVGPAGVARIVYFDYDSYLIKPEFQALIESHSRFLKANTGRKVVVEGHTDERGGREYNLALGQKRAEAVRKALLALGVPDSQLEAVSFGEEKPKATGSDEAALAENRRADIAYQ